MEPTRIGRLFERVRNEGRPALVAYVTAGDPSPHRTPGIIAALERGGADLIELGVPFSDPIADGPVIQRGAARALAAGATVATVLDIASEIRRHSEIPILLFTYMNPILRFGLHSLAREAAARGIDGCLMIDLSVEEAGPYVEAMRGHGLDTVFIAAPTSTPERLELVAQYSSGFVYVVSRTGVTGERDALSQSVGPLVQSMRSTTDLPLAVGFGISSAEHVRSVGAIADGVVVGSGFVRTLEMYRNTPELEQRMEERARELAAGLPRRAVPVTTA
jgi:tryptophan synthase alpha chain